LVAIFAAPSLRRATTVIGLSREVPPARQAVANVVYVSGDVTDARTITPDKFRASKPCFTLSASFRRFGGAARPSRQFT
jgi:hypothetical protein